ncbi:MAG TPA: FIST N-terminal domain-containing protein [Polyangiales bacterium]|nr:FIST N-terminal domain-containing protein [Polyangiales bacterium]
MDRSLIAKRGTTCEPEPERALRELAQQVGRDGLAGVLLFCSPRYDLAALGPALESTFDCPIIGCTSSGQIGPMGFQANGMTAVSFASEELTIRPFLVQPLSDYHLSATVLAERVRELRAHSSSERRAFGLMLVDGLSLKEERLVSALYRALGDVPIVGGSAGDDLSFERTHVYFGGRFLSDAAVFALFETNLPFAPFKFHHFVPSDQKVVITEAEPARRIVYEIDGIPAAQAYAKLIGVSPETLDARVCARNPLMLKLNGDYFVRSIQRRNPDDSLTLFCAIEAGLVLTLGRSVDPLICASRAFDAITARVPNPQAIIGCDCVLRRLELEADGVASQLGDFFAARGVTGFSTYGEQFNAMHVNQTFAGVALGSR